MKKDAYLKLPRSLFSSEGWQKATYEQKAVFIDLCFRAAFVEHEAEVSRGKVVVHEGQMIMTQAEMMVAWKMSRSRVRTIKE